MFEFDTGLSSIRRLQEYVKDKKEVEIKLSTDDLLVGRLIWQDQNCLCLVDQYENTTLIWQQAIVYLKPKA
ncbi:RNA-binding protein hfq [Aphanothece hegewaldii CCALA 016]|uniref:RNA-binding protein hfq n=1 Tax=Aphanothece hegewaldii CCALA 016 TaxID=2107694 RepID=A0A2T1LX85_9CHRO|nr:RNA-binding protein hfq [Aphanothece hegewaldii]PSF36684.1 RNA-binding protein hfq [Aphanothece hegewaldii CCALA 016]